MHRARIVSLAQFEKTFADNIMSGKREAFWGSVGGTPLQFIKEWMSEGKVSREMQSQAVECLKGLTISAAVALPSTLALESIIIADELAKLDGEFKSNKVFVDELGAFVRCVEFQDDHTAVALDLMQQEAQDFWSALAKANLISPEGRGFTFCGQKLEQAHNSVADVIGAYGREAGNTLGLALKTNTWLQKTIGKGTEDRRDKIQWPGHSAVLGDIHLGMTDENIIDHLVFIDFCGEIVNAVGQHSDDWLLDAQVGR